MNQDVTQFAPWNNLATNLAYICWAAGILIVLGYFVKLATTSDSKAKYDFINKWEIRILWIASIILIIGAGFFFNSNITKISTLWIFVLLFMTVMFGIMVALIVQNLLKFYYP